MARDGLDAVIVCGTEYTGFDGAVTYLSGFVIVHRYAYVLLPLEGDPSIVFPREATLRRRARDDVDRGAGVRRPARASGSPTACAGKRVGVYGLDYVMTVRDYQALEARPSSCRGTSSSTTRAP